MYDTVAMASIILLLPLAQLVHIGATGLLVAVFGSGVLQPNYTFRREIPLWSLAYVKWWTLYRMQDFASNTIASNLKGTVFLSYWYRLLGARIGRGVKLDTTHITDPALLFIGDGAVIGEGAILQSHEVRGGIVALEPVRIGTECDVGAFSVIQRGSVLDGGAKITVLGKTNVGEHVLRKSKQKTEQQISSPCELKKESREDFSAVSLGLRQLCGLYLVSLVSATSAVAAFKSSQYLMSKIGCFDGEFERMPSTIGYVTSAMAATFPWAVMGAVPLVAFQDRGTLLHFLLRTMERRKVPALLMCIGGAYLVYGLALLCMTTALKWYLVGKLEKQENMRPNSRHGFRIWLVHALLNSAHQKFVIMLSGTEATCIYLRGLGAEIGKMASIRGINAVVDPDLLSLGEQCHLGDFAKVVTSTINPDGSISIGRVTVGSKCVVGAQSVLMPGATLEKLSWLGAMSVAPANTALEAGVYVGIDAPVQVYNISATGEKQPITSPASIIAKIHEPKDCRIEEMDDLYQKIVANLSASIARTTISVNARYFHRLGVGARGTFRVLDNLSGLPHNDIFEPGRCYPVIIRHSNSLSGDDDARLDARGASLRILQPDCGDDLSRSLLDLTLKTGEGFYARNVLDFISWLTKDVKERETVVRKFPHRGQNIWDSLRCPDSYTELHYYSNVARIFCCSLPDETGVDSSKQQKFYAKFKIRPADRSIGEDMGKIEAMGLLPPETGTLPRLPGDNRAQRFLMEEFKNRMISSKGVAYVFQMQLHRIPESPEENQDALDCTLRWDADKCPFVDVAEIQLSEMLDDDTTEKLRFNPRNGPRSIPMITAKTALDSASIEHGRSLAYDISQYLRIGRPLPPAWQALMKKADSRHQVPASQMHTGGCPGMSAAAALPPSVEMFPAAPPHKIPRVQDVARKTKDLQAMASKFKSLAALQSTAIRVLQPVLQTIIPFMLLALAAYPSLLMLAFVGSQLGRAWIYGLLPLGYLCSGLVFAVVSICCRWILVGQTKDGGATKLWGLSTLCDTTWQSINMVLTKSFLELSKGTILATIYLNCLGADIDTNSVYLDTLHALNPDLLRIAAGAAVGRDALLFGHLYEEGNVRFKSIVLGERTFIGTRALLLPGLKMEDDAHLGALALGMKDEIIPAY